MLTRAILGAKIAFVVSVSANASVIISPTAVIANTLGDFGGDADVSQTIDHSGLFTNFVSGVDDFDAYLAGNPQHDWPFVNIEWFPPGGVVIGHIDYDLGAEFLIDRVAIWNEDAGGIRDATVLTSNEPDFASATIVGNLVLSDNPLNSPYSADIRALTPSFGRYVRVEILSHYNDQWDGPTMGEIAFSVPEPATLGLLALCALLARRR